jgi:pyruvate/2-oxoglutarate dehydrogenase complex dihydrolipoamide acyltransferase (E2) component
MPFEIILPQLGFAMQEGTLVEWLQPDGARVEAGQPLFSLETDKSVQEVESPASGTLTIVKEVGETYPVGTVLGHLA